MLRSIVLAAALLASPPALAQPGRPSGTTIREWQNRLKELFQRSHPCPVNGKKVGNCPGMEVGYIKHPRNGGAISQDNMRWMTRDEYERTDQDWGPSS